jgi:hypothetical protein
VVGGDVVRMRVMRLATFLTTVHKKSKHDRLRE